MNKLAKVFLMLLWMPVVLSAQEKMRETLSSSGSSHIVYDELSSYFIQESIGQASVIHTFTSTTNFSARQGFLQPISPSTIYNGFEDTIDADIWPNPFSEILNITFNEPLIGPIKVRIYDLTGRKVYDQSFVPAPSYVLSLDILARGAYTLILESQARSFTSKLLRG